MLAKSDWSEIIYKKEGYVIWVNIRYRVYRRILIVLLVIAFSAGLGCYYAAMKNKVPDEIRLIKGKEQKLSLLVPVSGEIAPVGNFGQEKLQKMQLAVSLDRPVTFQSSETGSYTFKCRLFGMIPLKSVNVNVIEESLLTPVGIPIGIYVKADGVLVLETGEIKGTDGMGYKPAAAILQKGDYIESVNGVDIENKRELVAAVKESGGEELILTVRREMQEFDVKVLPVLSADQEYKIGVWVRDNVQGIGTLTYIDEDLEFGALGHGINDIDTAELLELGSGTLYQTDIISVVRGESGSPGELMGVIDYLPENEIGVITKNTDHGVFGQGSDVLLEAASMSSYPAAMKQEIETGPAQILCSINGQAELYDVEITKVNMNSTGEDINRGIVLKVTDERLLTLTGGIVQGMSGSPILQNGKLIGAVTHVFVQDATKGFGIFIEEMLAG